MQDLLELPNAPSMFSMSCKVSTGDFEPIINSEESYFVKFSCDNRLRKNVIPCTDKYVNEFIDEVQGLALDIHLSSKVGTLPYYIPVFDKKLDIIPNLPDDFPMVALSLKDILTGGAIHKAGCVHEEKGVGLRAILLKRYCFENKKVLLFSSGSDTLLESIWYKRDKINYFNNIAKMGFYAATGFNFSLFVGECAFSQQLNMKRSLMSSCLYEHAGILTIPHIYALSYQQVKRWCEWLNLNPTIQYFVMNCQLQTSKQEITHVIQAVKAIFKSVPQVHAILHGFPINKVKDFNEDILRLHFADSLPHKKARNFSRLMFDKQKAKINLVNDDTVSIAELINNNFLEKLKYLEFIKQNIIEDYRLKDSA